ncbi:hypothetical protein [Helicobacter sp.]|uniref:hypothetical protein n=1 Tax=Helicobacter sp. TaxID=218 RepID=UPI0019B7EAC4|nr:hypothetical protein [Helicobacter sp.]MBD5165103.1 hypothetical protein [Helicobacter sp.]
MNLKQYFNSFLFYLFFNDRLKNSFLIMVFMRESWILIVFAEFWRLLKLATL